MRRDPKGLYARAYGGTAPELPGVAEQYEVPLHPEVTANGGFDEGAVERVLAALASGIEVAKWLSCTTPFRPMATSMCRAEFALR